MEGIEAICSTWPISKMIPVPKVSSFCLIIISLIVSRMYIECTESSIFVVNNCYRCAAWEYSAWVRTYALFVEERLECFRVLQYDVETDRSVRNYGSLFLWLLNFIFIFLWQHILHIYNFTKICYLCHSI